MGDFNKDIDQTVERLTNFDANNSIDGDKTDNLITELSGVNSYVKNMKPNRAELVLQVEKLKVQLQGIKQVKS